MTPTPLAVAHTYLHVREVGGNNRGPDVERFLANVNRKPGNAWCAAFVATCVLEAYQQSWNNLGNDGPFDPAKLPIPMVAGVFLLWSQTARRRRLPAPRKGCVYIIDKGIDPKTGLRIGHTGFVDDVARTTFADLSGNTNLAGSREGGGVYLRPSRKISDVAGWLDVESP